MRKPRIREVKLFVQGNTEVLLCNKGPSSQSYGFSSSHIQMWELDHIEGWAPKNWYFWTVVMKKTLESPLDCKEIKPVNPKGHQSWIFIGRTDAEAETPILWPPDGKSWLIWKDPDAGKDWRQEKKGTTEDEMVRWHRWFNRHEFGQALGDGEGQGSLEYCSPWGQKESDTTDRLNNNQGNTARGWCQEDQVFSHIDWCSANHTPYTGSHPYLFKRRRRKAIKTKIS